MASTNVWQRRQTGRGGHISPILSGNRDNAGGPESPSLADATERSPRAKNSQPSSEKVKVCLRVRPGNPGEGFSYQGAPCIQASGERVTVPRECLAEGSATNSPTKEAALCNEFDFDVVFNDAMESTSAFNPQERVFRVVGLPCVKAAIEGLNSTIMAYGQTGSGKTFTMTGGDSGTEHGIIPRVAAAVVEHMSLACLSDPESNIQVSMLEIYQEKIYDLLRGYVVSDTRTPSEQLADRASALHTTSETSRDLLQATSDMKILQRESASSSALKQEGSATPPQSPQSPKVNALQHLQSSSTPHSPRTPRSPGAAPSSPGNSPADSKSLRVREHPQLGPFIAGLTRRVVTSWPAMQAILLEGTAQRTVAPTMMNEMSSRSHAIFTLTVNQKLKKEDGSSSLQTSHIHLVDLAGSERQSRTNATGKQLKESGGINKSLTLLNNVITQLAAGSKFIPYRDSTLTWLLKESLGGNARTSLIACISPAWQDLKETLSTLRYASRARSIQNKPAKNQDPRDVTIQRLMAEVKDLRLSLSRARAPLPKPVHWNHAGIQVPDGPRWMQAASRRAPAREDSFAFQKPLLDLSPKTINWKAGRTAKASAVSAISRARPKSGAPDHLLTQSSFVVNEEPESKHSLSSPVMTSIPSTTGHQAHSELLHKVQTLLAKPKKRNNDSPAPPANSIFTSTPLPPLQPWPSLLRLEEAQLEWVQYQLPHGITKIGSRQADILISDLEPEHCEVLHVPEMTKADGSLTARRVSVLLYGGAKAAVNGHPLLRYALLEHGAELRLGPEPAKAVFRYYDPSVAR